MTFRQWLWYIFLRVFFPRSLVTMEWKMLRLLNKDRKEHGLHPVKMQKDLREVARKHSRDMARKDYFDHVNLKAHSPSDRLKLSGISDAVSGENLAKIGGFPHPVVKAEVGLMNSPGHRANILQPKYNVVGVGVVKSSQKVYFFTQNFAQRFLLFERKMPSQLKKGRKLQVQGRLLGKVGTVYWQVKRAGIDAVVREGYAKVRDGRFTFELTMQEVGRYEVFLFVGRDGDKHLALSDTIGVKVVRGWW